MALSFNKYHGIGNDFLVVEVESPSEISIERGRALCDRHYGVGGDGVLLVSAGEGEARARMTVINADGSTPEMCGNGLRCVALHLAREDGNAEARFVVDTGAGPLLCTVRGEEGGKRALVGTDIGRGSHVGSLDYTFSHSNLHFERIVTGNPHAICFREQLTDAELDEVGPAVSGLIDGGANVEIATLISPDEIRLAVWERGVGRTLACGTGAAATVIEAVRSGRSPGDRPVTVHLPGGDLEISVDRELRAYLRGPAEWIYSGSTEL